MLLCVLFVLFAGGGVWYAGRPDESVAPAPAPPTPPPPLWRPPRDPSGPSPQRTLRFEEFVQVVDAAGFGG